MRDEEYRPDQIGQYGVAAQPAITARMKPHLRMTQLGNGVAVVALGAAVLGVLGYPDFTGSAAAALGEGSAVTTLACAAIMLATCSFQHFCWLRAGKQWSGSGSTSLEPLKRASWIVHVVSYLVVLVALWSTATAVVQAGWAATASIWLTLSLVMLMTAQVTAGVQYLRESGPPGTLPAHIRRLRDRERRARLGPL